ncbi:MAG: adenosylcobalamin-dependent ribonucleoside-diphosphate reductase, partial [Candidatus Pacearchaeota archaeon]
HAKTAKAYILYRQERRAIREEKKKILGKDEIDEVDKRFDVNGLRVLASRYLNRNAEGKIIESPKQLFERVATHIALSDILHDSTIFDKDGKGLSGREIDEEIKEIELLRERIIYGGEGEGWDRSMGDGSLSGSESLGEREGNESGIPEIKIGKYKLNKWHIEALLLGYSRLLKEGKMKCGIKKFLEKLQRGDFNEYEKNIDTYYELMVSKDFMPNSPTLMNAGNRLGQLSACFVLPIHDSLASIMKTSSDAAFIAKAGGGVGINYSEIRPAGDLVASTSGVASGPISFMEIINTITEVVKQGGKRRGANMAILEIWHPDIEQFIAIKQNPKKLENFNLSVGVWDDFFEALEQDKSYSLINPKTKKQVKSEPARKLFDLISFSAWKSAEPGVLFFDNINKYNVLINVKGLIRSTNPCGEQPLYEYESCNLGSINLKNFVKENEDGSCDFDWKRFEQVVRLCTRFLDNVIDINKYPLEEIEKTTRASRKIGLGVMGLADCLFELGIAYNSEAGYEFMAKIAEALSYFSMDESTKLAKERGSFSLFDKSEYKKGKIPIAGYYEIPKSKHNYDWDRLIEKAKEGIRNSFTTTIAPTGSISMIAGCSNGIEPVFSLVYEKHVAVGKFYYINEVFEKKLKASGLYNDTILDKVCKNYGCLLGLSEFDEEMQKVFVTALSIHWLDHIVAQAIWQKWIAASISKTINMLNEVSVEDVKLAYLIARELGLKGLTVYRDGSRGEQVFYVGSKSSAGDERQKLFNVMPSKYALLFIKGIKNQYVKNELNSYIKRFDYFSISVADMASTQEYGQELKQEQKLKQNWEQKWEQKQKRPEQHSEIFVSNIKEGAKALEINEMRSIVTSDEKDDGKCPLCLFPLVFEAGCNKCMNCGWSSCVVS